MNRAIVKLLVLGAMLLMLVMATGAASQEAPASRGAEPASEPEVFTGAEESRTCRPLLAPCAASTDCCIGRCINRRCLKL
jgi:hypothetical protein